MANENSHHFRYATSKVYTTSHFGGAPLAKSRLPAPPEGENSYFFGPVREVGLTVGVVIQFLL
jgi:hypothetical protein